MLRDMRLRYPEGSDCHHLYDYASSSWEGDCVRIHKRRPGHIDGYMRLAGDEAKRCGDYMREMVVMDDYCLGLLVGEDNYSAFSAFFDSHSQELTGSGLVEGAVLSNTWTMGVVLIFGAPLDLRRMTGPVEQGYIYDVRVLAERIVAAFFEESPSRERPARWQVPDLLLGGDFEEEDEEY